MVKGGPNAPDPRIAAFAAATPKINTGTVRGNTNTASSRPPRRRATESAAPTRPIKVSAGVPAASVSASQPAACNSTLSMNPSRGAITTSGNPVVIQCAIAFVATVNSSGIAAIIRRSSEPSSWSVANSRSSASKLASSAPSQRIAGPIRLSSARSGPIAKGIMVTTIKKNNAPMSAPPPTRVASCRSRRRSALNDLMPSLISAHVRVPDQSRHARLR